MKVFFHKNFQKQLHKLPVNIQNKFFERLGLFVDEPTNSIVRVHTLSGDKFSYESMNVSSDYRTLFIRNRAEVTFYEIGTHSELY
jgi:mRNA-degrading endonuclease YafQ of YafQ-DinJ toxin-antitoxin module